MLARGDGTDTLIWIILGAGVVLALTGVVSLTVQQAGIERAWEPYAAGESPFIEPGAEPEADAGLRLGATVR